MDADWLAATYFLLETPRHSIGSTIAIERGMKMKSMGFVGGALMTAMAAVAMTGCLSDDEEGQRPEPGVDYYETFGNWVQGEWTSVQLNWPNMHECSGDDWFCKPMLSTTTMVSAECDGCEIVETPNGTSVQSKNPIELRVVPTTDEEIELRVKLRFDETRDTKEFVIHAMGDHETGLEVGCGLIDTSAMIEQTQGIEGHVPANLIRSCATPRLGTDTVLLFPSIVTARGRQLFPFEANQPLPGNRLRTQVTFSSGVGHWAFTNLPFSSGTQFFAEVPNSFTGSSVEVSAPLADGSRVSMPVAVPRVGAGAQ